MDFSFYMLIINQFLLSFYHNNCGNAVKPRDMPFNWLKVKKVKKMDLTEFGPPSQWLFLDKFIKKSYRKNGYLKDEIKKRMQRHKCSKVKRKYTQYKIKLSFNKWK